MAHLKKLTSILLRIYLLLHLLTRIIYQQLQHFRNHQKDQQAKKKKHRQEKRALVKAYKAYRLWSDYYDSPALMDHHTTHNDIKLFSKSPVISIIMPVYNPPKQLLILAIKSVLQQSYNHWELCIANDASTLAYVGSILDDFAKRDQRIKVLHRKENGHISQASNSALNLASGDFLGMLDHDDLLSADALYWMVKTISENPQAKIIYSDEDKIDKSGMRLHAYFKPDWDRDLFYNQNLLSHFTLYAMDEVNKTNGFRKGYEGSQDYDLALQIVENVQDHEIKHIPKVLYHWRAIEGSTAAGISEKPYATFAATNAIADSLKRQSLNALASWHLHYDGIYRVQYLLPTPLPTVSLIIFGHNSEQHLENCLQSVLEKTDYDKLEIIIAQHEPLSHQLKTWCSNNALNIQQARDRNAAGHIAKGCYCVFVNGNTSIINHGWLRELISQAARNNSGAVAGTISFHNSLYEGGILLLNQRQAGFYSHQFMPIDGGGYYGRAISVQSFSAVTANLLAIKTHIFKQTNGFDDQLSHHFLQAIDFSLQLKRLSYTNRWTPYAQCTFTDLPEDYTIPADKNNEAKLISRWLSYYQYDPAYNPNLSDTCPYDLAWPPKHFTLH